MLRQDTPGGQVPAGCGPLLDGAVPGNLLFSPTCASWNTLHHLRIVMIIPLPRQAPFPDKGAALGLQVPCVLYRMINHVARPTGHSLSKIDCLGT